MLAIICLPFPCHQQCCTQKNSHTSLLKTASSHCYYNPHLYLLLSITKGITGNTLAWIRSFLTNMSQQVVVDGVKSTSAPVTSGVTQGSVLRPILFLAFINNMPECIQSKCHLFADDSIIYRPVASDKDDCQSL